MTSDYLGIQIERLEYLGTIKLFQKTYLESLIKRHEFKISIHAIYLYKIKLIPSYTILYFLIKKNLYQLYIENLTHII
jgi:hypothetical protein